MAEYRRVCGFPLFNLLQRRQHGIPDGKDFGFAAARSFRTVRAEFHHDARVAAILFYSYRLRRPLKRMRKPDIASLCSFSAS